MKSQAFAVALAAMISGCAQNQVSGYQGSQPTSKSFEACGLSVRFSGEASEMSLKSASELIDSAFGGKTEGIGWLYASHRQGIFKNEIAFCACPNEPNLAKLQDELTRPSIYSKYVAGIGHVTEQPIVDGEGGRKVLAKVALGEGKSCVLMQMVVADGPAEAVKHAASPFLDSLAAIPKEPQQTAVFRKGSGTASERLKQLDQLLSEKLITSKEYETRRTAILESL